MDDSSTQLQHQAILAALSSNWEEALKLNLLIIDTDPNNVEALNRIGRAYFELGELTKSQEFFENSLKHDPYNQIAAKFLKRIETFCKKGVKIGNHTHHVQEISSDFFIEEPGKTKLIGLLKVAEPQKLSLLSPGMTVNLVTKNRGIVATDDEGKYLGALPDDLSHRLARFIKGGNKYQAIIKTIKVNSVSILIREVFRSSRFKNQPSFLDNLNMNITYSSDHIVVPMDGEDESPYDSDDEEPLP